MGAEKRFQVAIVGGGIAGVTLAIALNARRVPVTIYEQAPKFGEVGAGVSFSPNAVQAMKACHDGIYQAFEKVCTTNVWPSKKNVWFDYLDGHDQNADGHQQAAFTITNSLGQTGVHRARFLDEMVKLIPSEIARFGKRLEEITTKEDDGRLRLRFTDGSTAEADVVIGCDGIKSKVRQIIVGEDHPSAYPTYTHKYAYRGLVPMDKAIEVIGEERAKNACMHMGPDGHVLTFAVNHGEILNIVAFRTTKDDWPDYQKLTRPAKREDALKDFSGYGANVLNLLKLTNADLDVWAIFDLAENPVSTFRKGRIAISGDAAHATSPHHGAGAGFCIEDSAILADLLADDRVHSHSDLEAALDVFETTRKDRGQWLVQSSRFIGDCYEWRANGVGDDFEKIEAEINRRNGIINNVDIGEMSLHAKEELGEKLSMRSSL